MAAARNVTETGFEMCICTRGGMPIGSVGVSWAIFDSVGKGKYPTLLVATHRSTGDGMAPMFNEECVMMHRGPAGKVEFAAISTLDLRLDDKVWVEIKVDMEMHHGMPKSPTVRMTAGPVDSRVYSVGSGFYTV